MNLFNFKWNKKENLSNQTNTQEDNSSNIETKKKTLLDYLSIYGKRAFLGFSLLTAPLLASKDGIGFKSQSRDTFKKNQTEHVVNKSNEITLDAVNRFHVQDSLGTVRFNEWSLISPIQIEGKIEKNIEDSALTTIPYHYAQTFKEIVAESPEHRDSLEKQLIKDLKEEFSQSLNFYGIGTTTQEVDAYKKGGMRKEGIVTSPANVKSITITGLASPEARTPESIKSGNIDPENIQLATDRAKDVSPFVKQALSELGIDTSKVLIKSEEVQFTDGEYEAMVTLADKLGYISSSDTIGGVYKFIKDYNLGTITDTNAVKQMDSILKEKRGVKIQVVSEGKESKDIVVPLPLLLLLLPSVFRGLKNINWEGFWRKKKTKQESGEGDDSIPEKKKERQIFSEATFDQEILDIKDKNFHDLYRSAIETEKANYQDIQRISDLVYSEEIYPYLNHSETIEKGLDYKQLIDNTRKWRSLKPPHYRADSEIKEKLAEHILEDWQEYDRNVRSGIKTVDGNALPVETTVEYRHDPKKIIWAIQAAAHIFELSNSKDDQELEKNMDKRLIDIETKRITEIKGIPAQEKIPDVSKNTVSVEEKKPSSKEKSSKESPELSLKAGEDISFDSDDEAFNPYSQYQEDNESFGNLMGGFAQALSQENLQKIWGDKEAQNKKDNLQDEINSIDSELRSLEKKLESSEFRKDEKISLEQEFNKLEAKKRELQKLL